MSTYKLGSLFDGSGGFPLAGTLCGIEPRWASEVEPYPIAVTRSRFPKMKHLGDISKINGAEIEPVDIITFGSPCQDLSVAGKQAGLKHEANGDEETTRSGLFMEAVRIIKEMRYATNGEYPTFALWENVPGAFSSNKGEDFRIVLEELIKIVEPSASVPSVPPRGWAYADSYVGDGWSLAYRILDAQYWGVAQRRRRVYLVVDFRGERAREILFEREGLRGHFTQGGTPWQGTPAEAQGGSGANDREGEGFNGYNGVLTGDKSATLGVNCGLSSGRNGIIDRGRQLDAITLEPGIARREGGHIYEGVSGTLRANAGDNQMSVAYSVENHPNDSRVKIDESGRVQALTSRMGTGGGNVPMVMEPFCKSARGKFKGDAETWKDAKVANTLNTFDQGEARANELVVYAVDQGGGKSSANVTKNTSPTLCTTHGGAPAAAHVIALDRASFNQGENAKYDFEISDKGVNSTLVARGPSAVAYSFDQGATRDVGKLFIEETSKTLTNGTCPGHHNGVVIAQDDKTYTASKASFFTRGSCERADCLVATDYKDPPIVTDKAETYRPPSYIVRRLTPTECARLQGFPDRWGDIDEKTKFTEDELIFWREARNTYDAINGRQAKDYTAKQMLTWYNKLQGDSAEYKMWGNGIALPTALYVMQGITDALNSDDWML